MCGGGGSVSSGPDSRREAMQVHGEDRTVCVWGGGGCTYQERTGQFVCVWWWAGHILRKNRTGGGGRGTYQERTGQCGGNLGLLIKVGWQVFKTAKQRNRSFVASNHTLILLG